MKLYEKLHSIQDNVDGFVKDKKTNNYDYVSGSQVLDYIRPLMNAAKLILKQEVLSIENVRQDYATAAGKAKNEILSKVMMRFTWIDCETGDKDENLFGANGMNDWDKGVGSALTYAERYFLLKYFHIPTDKDDVDGLNRDNGHAQTQAKEIPSKSSVYDRNDVASCQGIDDMNQFIKDNWISKMTDQQREDLWAKANTLNLFYDKTSRSFTQKTR